MRVSRSSSTLRNKKVLITAGPTREHWDPVRFLTNASSGRMGIALAAEAARLGARVILVLGPVSGPAPENRKNLRVVPVISALDMDREVQAHVKGTEVFIGAAAVSDFRPAATARQKLKGKPETLTLKMKCNPDIIAHVARRGPRRPTVVVGFALETQNVMKHAKEKLNRKGLDWIVANRETNLGAADGSVTLLSRWYDRIVIGRMTKERLAKQIWNVLLDRPAL